jgi:hypothetical protein
VHPKNPPSNEIETTLNLLFKKHKRGLYAQDFAKVAGFPRADLSHAYLVGASFGLAWCQGASFKYAASLVFERICEQRICTICWQYLSSSNANSCKV